MIITIRQDKAHFTSLIYILPTFRHFTYVLTHIPSIFILPTFRHFTYIYLHTSHLHTAYIYIEPSTYYLPLHTLYTYYLDYTVCFDSNLLKPKCVLCLQSKSHVDTSHSATVCFNSTVDTAPGYTLGWEDDDETPCNTWNIEQCSFEYVIIIVCLSKKHF